MCRRWSDRVCRRLVPPPTGPVRLSAVVVVVIACLLLAATPVWAAWEHPVDAGVVDPFRPPASRFGAGNRGLEYGTAGGETVRAVDDGTVVFAGSVGGRRHVVIDHGNGLRSAYAFVSPASVARGQVVAQGQAVAVADAGFHLTARLGQEYVDPMLLMAGAEVLVHLVPGSLPAVPPHAMTARPRPLAAVLDAAGDLTLSRQFEALAGAAADWHHIECTDDGQVVAPPGGPAAMSERLLIQVGGLGTSSDGASIGSLDHSALGYAPGHVLGFSYAGGCTPEAFGGGRGEIGRRVGATTYAPEDTFQDIDVSATRLADLVEEVASLQPGRPIDIAAHSLGGVVTRRAIELLDDRGALGPVVVVLTIGSPHGGADLATAAVATAGSERVEKMLDPVLGEAADFRTATAVIDIAESGGGGVVDPEPPPTGITVVAVAGSSDLVVAGEHAGWDGATNVVVPTSLLDAPAVHGDLPGMPQVAREMELAIAGAAPRCVGLASVLGAALQARGISAVEDGMTLVAGLARWVL